MTLQKLKEDFPLFKTHPQLVYLDSTATALKPQSVIAKENEYYTQYSANIFRGIYKISEQATAEYEAVREKLATFIGANSQNEIVFVRNTTEAINLVASSWGRVHITAGDEIVTTIMEHHANFVPWQALCSEKNAPFTVIGLTAGGEIDQPKLLAAIGKKTKLVAITHISNVLGTINPITKLVRQIKAKNPSCLVLVDGAQAVPHLSVDVSALDCDFYAFSSHKMLGPTGVGVLWGKRALLDSMAPYQYGGEMIQAVYTDHTDYKSAPYKFEAGTPHIAGVIGLGAAVDYLQKIGMEQIQMHEQEITAYAIEKLTTIKGINIIGPKITSKRAGILAFTIDKIHAHDIAQILDSNNICIRSGHHCAMPLHIALDLTATARASFYLYTTKTDIDALINGLQKVFDTFHT
jgi:cysteine desulfurase/selenocysteine lyase